MANAPDINYLPMKPLSYAIAVELRPTQHKGAARAVKKAVKSVTKVVKAVAPILVSIAAPAIGSAIAGSMGLAVTSTLGRAALGAATGAALGGITGTGIGRGALLGGAGGLASGLFGGGATTAGTTAGTTTGAAGAATGPGLAGAATPITSNAAMQAARVATAQQAAAAAAAPTTLGSIAQGVQSAASNLWGSVSSVAENLGVSRDGVAKVALQTAANLVTGANAPDIVLSDAEQTLLDMQMQNLEQLRRTDTQLFNQRMQEAQNLFSQRDYYNPDYWGTLAASQVRQSEAARQQEELAGMQPFATGRQAEAERRSQIAAGAATPQAYTQGQMFGVQQQTDLTRVGLNALPTASDYGANIQNMAGLTTTGADRAMASTAERSRQYRSNIATLFPDIFATQPREEDDTNALMSSTA